MTYIADIRYQGELHNELQHLPSKRIIHTDAPTDNQGKGEAFSPTDLLASALAACVMTMMGMKAKNQQRNGGKSASRQCNPPANLSTR